MSREVSSVEFDPAVPSDVWEQATPLGGADLNGLMPRTAVPVLPVGVQTVRVVPSLVATLGNVALVSGAGAVMLVGRTPQRRHIVVWATSAGAAVVTLSENKGQATAGYGARLPLNAPIPLPYAGDLYVATTGADAVVSFAAMIDQG